MANVTITIKAVELKGKNAAITGQDGKKYWGFINTKDGQPTGLAKLNPGDEIEGDVTVNGNFTNIGAFHIIARNTAQPAQERQQTAPGPKQVEVSGPEHGMGVKLVGDLYIAGKLDDKHPLVIEMFKELHRIMGTAK